MIAKSEACNPDALRQLLADKLSPVRVGEVEDHLEYCQHCRTALEDLAGGDSWLSAVGEYLTGTADDEPTHPELDDALDFLSPSEFPDSLGRIAHYEVKGVLGRGGNGIVLKAHDPGLNRFVAVKVIASVLAGSGAARKRFAREAQAAAAVVHEHVVAVHAVSESGGLPYLVMEYVPGRSLQGRIDRQGPLGLIEILRIGMQTASGLAAAHAQGLVHRDIKPANILLEHGIERVKITDFGLARAVADASLTQSGVITGTPQYMAPEQARGDAVDHRADLFTLGSTLYAMATGHAPFRAETPLAVLRRVTDDTPRPIRETNPEMPAWFELIVAKLMQKEADERFQSASEVAELLERCLAHVQQPLAVPLPVIPGMRRRWRKPPAWLPAAAAVLLVTGIVAWSKWPQDGPKDTPKLNNLSKVVIVEQSVDLPKADEIDRQLDDLDHDAAFLEILLGAPRRQFPSGDPIDIVMRSAAQQADELERELTPNRQVLTPKIPNSLIPLERK